MNESLEFTLKTRISATTREIYRAWLSSEGHSNMTGGRAMISDKIGDEFTAWDGYISGVNLALEVDKKIVQSWRTSEFHDDEEDSKLEVTLTEVDGLTELTLRHSNLPESGAHYRKGWDVHYFQPMELYFSRNSS